MRYTTDNSSQKSITSSCKKCKLVLLVTNSTPEDDTCDEINDMLEEQNNLQLQEQESLSNKEVGGVILWDEYKDKFIDDDLHKN